MSMSRMHFRAIADVLNRAAYLTDDQRLRLADGLANVLTRFNGNFRRSTFVDAATKSNEKGE